MDGRTKLKFCNIVYLVSSSFTTLEEEKTQVDQVETEMKPEQVDRLQVLTSQKEKSQRTGIVTVPQ